MNDTIARRIATALERIAAALEKQAGIEPPEEPKSAYEDHGVQVV